jgi:regulator of sigma E protease
VMNLITGVMFAAAAFLYGVPYLPAVVGDVTPGGPAYQAGIEPGGKVVAVGGIRQDDELYFTEMATAIMVEGIDQPDRPINVSIEYPDGIRHYELQTAAVAGAPGFRRVGIAPLFTTHFPARAGRVAAPGSAAAGAISEADAGAEVIAIDGTPILGAGERDNVQGSVMLQQQIMARPSHPLNLQLRRTDGSTAEVVIPPQLKKMPGIGLEVGPVIALVAGGPAADAGVKVGDLLVAVDGEEDLDALALPAILADASGPVSMTFRRTQGDQLSDVDVQITPTDPVRTASPVNPADNAVALDGFGLAYRALPKVSVVYPSPSDSGQETGVTGLQQGDILKKVVVRWPGGVVPETVAGKEWAPLRKKLEQGWEFTAEYPLAALIDRWQFFPDQTELRITVSRNDRIVEVDTLLANTGGYWYDRGLRFAELERTHVANSLGQAAALGLETSKRRLTEVFRFLGMLVTGKAKADMIGGPITIFAVAGHETSRGIPALLMFLTLLSMNLAILNFLPIPALDGGHMLFLTTEAVLGRPVNEKLQMQLTMAGVLALLSLMAFAIFNDIRRFQ